MTIKEVLALAKKNHKRNRSALECEILLSNLLNKDRIFLHLYDDFVIDKDILDSLLKQINLLNNGYPIEYITNKVSFYSQEFFINENALIPRPETEILIEKSINLIDKYNIKNIYEIGVGSGVISIILCLLKKDIKITSSDISQKALEIAKQNIVLKSELDSTLQNRIRLVHTNLLDGEKIKENSLIISNPPYIRNNYKIPKNLTFEPQVALFGGENGDEIIRKIIELDSSYLCCEIGYNQKNIEQYLTKYKFIEFYKDYSNFYRGFIASKR
ncbi:HemK/PrmC family methyltransferase [Helicobacter sp. MIT 14-3879]|uniref:HemK/PrmC family methyltransferase n=1 Tax=Helicobacter sp. MIT 14-3879 TaxID=2040649 RepID=UPI000E1EDCB7|nr:HemK/PrmC family methyltransferase [Helicobacter sp. MIT 14-3879]RDU65177.1 peptide chain release factor N(5)-glutamine methyltransferase [Helicobacter sp. MIT 14-3879]